MLNKEIDKAFATHKMHGLPIHAYLKPMMEAFVKSGCADQNYLIEIQSADIGQFWAHVWEAMLYWKFRKVGWTVSGPGKGPDFLINTQDGSVLVEATVPGPDGLPEEWLAQTQTGVYSMPHEQMLLRWTAKLSDKRTKHTQDIKKGYADPEAPFVIAINSSRLSRHGIWECGISQWPFPVEATFPVGPLAISANIDTQQFGEAFQTPRFNIQKTQGIEVPTDNFLDPSYRCVSALLGCVTCYAEESIQTKFDGLPPFFVVHNPLATNPLPRNWLMNSIEYAADLTGPDEYLLRRIT